MAGVVCVYEVQVSMQDGVERLRLRLRAQLLVGSLLGPGWCVFGALGLLADGWVRWLILGGWVIVGALLGLLVARALRTLAALAEQRSQL